MNNWQIKKLGDISEITKGRLLNKDNISDTGKNPCIHYGELFIKYSEIIKKIIGRTDISEGVFYSKAGDVLMPASDVTPRGLATASYLPFNNVIIGGDILVIRPKENQLDGRFYAYFVAASKSTILRLTSGSTIFHLYGSDIKKMNFNLPSKPEQQRIVSVLEMWDEYLELLDKKIALKERLKKGLMQQLLTGKRRLPGYIDNWKELRLGDIGATYAGLAKKSKEDFGIGKPFVTYMNIYSNPVIDVNIFGLVKIDEMESQNKVKMGDILFTTSSETPNEVGFSSVLLNNCDELYLNSFCFGFRLKNPKLLSASFAGYYFRDWKFRKSMTRIAQGASRYNLSKKYFMDTKIFIPKTIEEQNEISKLLNSFSKEIDMLNNEKTLIQLQKKYLLKNLINGKIRTPENLKIKELDNA